MLADGGACFRHAPSVLSTGGKRDNKTGRRAAGIMQQGFFVG